MVEKLRVARSKQEEKIKGRPPKTIRQPKAAKTTTSKRKVVVTTRTIPSRIITIRGQEVELFLQLWPERAVILIVKPRESKS